MGLQRADEVPPLETHGLLSMAQEEGAKKAFKQLQRQRSWSMLVEDMCAAKSVFEDFDRDGDGKLSAQELKRFLIEQDVELQSLAGLRSAIELASGRRKETRTCSLVRKKV